MSVPMIKINGSEVTGAELQKVLQRCWNITDMVERFNVSGMTIHNWRSFRRLPAVVIPGDVRPALRFIPNEVVEWARENGVRMYPVRERDAA